jgi:hypothetical protein
MESSESSLKHIRSIQRQRGEKRKMKKSLFTMFMLVALSLTLLPAAAMAAPPGQGEGKLYTIQKDDWLSRVADKEYGSALAYQAIVYHTNKMAETDVNINRIDDPNRVDVGWVIYLPSVAEAQAYMDTAGTAGSGLSGQLQLAGSTTVQPLAEKLAEAFMAKSPDVSVEVQGGGSSVGVTSAGEGTVGIGNASREVKSSTCRYSRLRMMALRS